MKYNDEVYLHQSIVRRNEGLVRHVDLPDAVAAFGEGQADGEWRIHCHVPVFLADLGEISSTRSDLVATLAALRQKSPFISSRGRDLYVGRSAGQTSNRLEVGRHRP